MLVGKNVDGKSFLQNFRDFKLKRFDLQVQKDFQQFIIEYFRHPSELIMSLKEIESRPYAAEPSTNLQHVPNVERINSIEDDHDGSSNKH